MTLTQLQKFKYFCKAWMVPEGMKHNLTEYISYECLQLTVATGSEYVWSKLDPLCSPEPKDLEKHFCTLSLLYMHAYADGVLQGD